MGWHKTIRKCQSTRTQSCSCYIITKDADSDKNLENQNVIEKIVMDNEIPITESHRNNTGDIVLVCETKKDRDELKNLVNRADDKIEMNSPNTKQVPITIVGLPKNCNNNEAIKMLVLQNQFIKKFSTVNNKIEEHITIHQASEEQAKCLSNFCLCQSSVTGGSKDL